jgi:hypothetical protein
VLVGRDGPRTVRGWLVIAIVMAKLVHHRFGAQAEVTDIREREVDAKREFFAPAVDSIGDFGN